MNGGRIDGRKLALAAVLAPPAAFLIWRAFFQDRPADANVLSGYIEGDALYMAAPAPGALTALSVARGQPIKAGQPLFRVDDAAARAQKAQALATLDQARAQAMAAEASAAQAHAALDQASVQADKAARDAARTEAAAKADAGAVAAQDLDQARAARDQAQDQRKAAAAAASSAQAQARAAATAVAHAQAVVDEAQARLGQMAASAPSDGRVEDTYMQVGEWAPANQPVLSLIPDGQVKLRFYVPEAALAAYQVGRTVAFGCDACAAGLTAKINYVSPRPEYTPPVIYSRRSRDRLMFLIEALPANARNLTPGEPVDVQPLKAGDAKAQGQ